MLKYEQMVAPTNYKRPKALISQNMIDSALLKINELGLESALHRRLANIHDISVNDVLWADTQSIPLMKDALQAILKPTKQTAALAMILPQIAGYLPPIGQVVVFL